ARAVLDRVPAGGAVQGVAAPGEGDDTIAELAGRLPGRRFVITADRELRRRRVAGGAARPRPRAPDAQPGARPRPLPRGRGRGGGGGRGPQQGGGAGVGRLVPGAAGHRAAPAVGEHDQHGRAAVHWGGGGGGVPAGAHRPGGPGAPPGGDRRGGGCRGRGSV